jgi:hypothetical protein
MAAFDHILLLFSFVFALALTHLLSRVGALLLARKRVRFSALPTLMILNAVGWVYANWLLLWDLHGIRNWDLASITTWFAFAVSNYFICVAAAPDVEPAGPIDMEQFYWDNRGLFYVLMLLATVLAMGTNIIFLRTSDPSLFFKATVDTAPNFVPPILALAVSARWAQWVSGLAIFGLTIWWTIGFSGSLQ